MAGDLSIRTYYLNADFDLALRPRPRQLDRPALVQQVAELSLQGLLGAGPEDSVVLRAEPSAEWLDWLTRCGHPLPRLLEPPAVVPESEFCPFGWSDEAIELGRRHTPPSAHPTRECIRRVNSRSFAQRVEGELFPSDMPAAQVDSLEALESWLESSRGGDAGWMLKSEFGNAGLANRRVRGARLSAADRRFVRERLVEDDHLVVEPWLPRLRDWTAVFDVPFQAHTFRVHETVMTADGGLIGAMFADREVPPELREQLGAAARRVAQRLEREGYLGPVCVDAFEWRDGERPRLRPLVDLNCRRSMSEGAYRLSRGLLSGRTVYYRFFNRSKLDLSDELRAFLSRLDDRRYDPVTRLGVLPVSPLSLQTAGRHWRPAKLAVLFVAHGRDEAFAQERWFRDRFEK